METAKIVPKIKMHQTTEKLYTKKKQYNQFRFEHRKKFFVPVYKESTILPS